MGAARFALPASLAGVAAGILLADAPGSLPTAPFLVGGLLLGSAAVAVRGRFAALAIAAVAITGVGVGAWRWEAASPPAGDDSVASLVGDEEHRLAGTVLDDPRPRGDRLQLVLGDVREATDLVQDLCGTIPGVRGVFGGRLRNAHQVEALTANLISVIIRLPARGRSLAAAAASTPGSDRRRSRACAVSEASNCHRFGASVR